MNKKTTKKLLKIVNRQMQWKNVCPASIVSSYKSIESFAILQLQFTSLLFSLVGFCVTMAATSAVGSGGRT